LGEHPAERLVAMLLDRMLSERPAGETLKPVELGGKAAAAAPHKRAPSGAMELFSVNLGAKDGAEANWILPLVCRRGGVSRREVGAIRIGRERTHFEIAASVAAEFAANAAERDPRAPHVRIEPAAGPLPERSSPAGSPRPPSRGKRPSPPKGRAAPARPHARKPPHHR
jgi:ATP-dependent RNA helicase DeaD